MNVLNKFSNLDGRSKKVRKNVFFSFGLKAISIIVSLQVVPLTIGYVNPVRYGIWLTLSSIIHWLAYFDLGFGNGFRNKFAESMAKGNLNLARQYVSTTYAVLSIIFIMIILIVSTINHFIDWSGLLNIDNSYNEELNVVFLILTCSFSVHFVCSIFNTMLIADQKPALATLMSTLGQIIGFVSVYVLTRCTVGNLVLLAFAFSVMPTIFILIASLVCFRFTSYKKFAPSIKLIKFSLTRDIVKLGIEFFLITISILVVYQCINIILTRQVGAVAVTQYNIAYKYMNVLFMVFSIILAPIWSAVTNAYTQKDYAWIKKCQNRLEQLWVLALLIGVIMAAISPFVYRWWIGNSVEIDLLLTIGVTIYVITHIASSMYMHIINGIGKLRVQLLTYVPFVVVALPLINYFCKVYGTAGVIIVPSLVFLIQALIGRIQLKKIINGTAKGIWNK